MESNKNNNNDNYGEEQQQQQLRGSAKKRKFNELANDGHGQPTAAGEQNQQEPPENLSKKKCEHQGNEDLEVC
jgi:hypothetical protein